MIRKKQERTSPIVVDLTGPNGNAFALMGLASRLAKQLGIESPTAEMMSGDYENLLQTFDKSFGSVVTMYR